MSAFIIETIIKVLVVVLVFSFLGGFATYIERKVLGFFQRRLGPMYVGPYGLLQFAADAQILSLNLFQHTAIVKS